MKAIAFEANKLDLVRIVKTQHLKDLSFLRMSQKPNVYWESPVDLFDWAWGSDGNPLISVVKDADVLQSWGAYPAELAVAFAVCLQFFAFDSNHRILVIRNRVKSGSSELSSTFFSKEKEPRCLVSTETPLGRNSLLPFELFVHQFLLMHQQMHQGTIGPLYPFLTKTTVPEVPELFSERLDFGNPVPPAPFLSNHHPLTWFNTRMSYAWTEEPMSHIDAINVAAFQLHDLTSTQTEWQLQITEERVGRDYRYTAEFDAKSRRTLGFADSVSKALYSVVL